MKIDSIKLKNFRGYRSETEINFNDLTVFVGKNDIGKSTILESKIYKRRIKAVNRFNENIY